MTNYERQAQPGKGGSSRVENDDSLLDLISGYGKEPPKIKEAKVKSASAPKGEQAGKEKK